MTFSLHTIVIASLILALVSMLIIIIDILAGNRQHMMIMNFVYPLTALYAGPLALLVYYGPGRKSTHKAMMKIKQMGQTMPGKQKPFWQSVLVGALHCGSGCTLGDIIGESILFYFPLIVFGHALFGSWIIDYLLAFSIGILFQYYSIKPMKKMSPGKALKAALKADTLSLTSWQIGMYAWMAIVNFAIFGHELKANDPLFWFMMQIAMLFGLLTAYPVNWWLLKKNIKEVM